MCLHGTWVEQTLQRQAQVILTATMHGVGVRCVDLRHHHGCASNCTSFSTCSATLFLSFEVRACCNSAVDFTSKKVVSVVVIFQIEVARDFYVTKQKNQRFLWCLSTSRVLEESYLRRASVACIAARNQTFASYLSLKLSVLPLHEDLA